MTFQTLRLRVPLPPLSQPLSIADFTLSELLLRSSASNSTTTVLVESSTGVHVSYSLFLSQIHSLTTSLRSSTSLSKLKGHVAFILVPPSTFRFSFSKSSGSFSASSAAHAGTSSSFGQGASSNTNGIQEGKELKELEYFDSKLLEQLLETTEDRPRKNNSKYGY